MIILDIVECRMCMLCQYIILYYVYYYVNYYVNEYSHNNTFTCM